MPRQASSTNSKDPAANLGFEAKLWLAADKLRNNMDAAEYKHEVLANGSMSSNQSGDCNARSTHRNRATNWQGLGSQLEIRQKLIEAGLVDCMVALPGQLFYST